MDHLHTLNDLTPKIKCNGRNGIDPDLIFGLDSKLFNDPTQMFPADASHNDEVETVTVTSGASVIAHPHSCCECDSAHHDEHTHLHQESHSHSSDKPVLTEGVLISALSRLSKESIWRVKGFVRLFQPPGMHIINWAFGRYDLRLFDSSNDGQSSYEADVLLTVMGERGEVRRLAAKFAQSLGAVVR